jgi:hypothetical protein
VGTKDERNQNIMKFVLLRIFWYKKT